MKLEFNEVESDEILEELNIIVGSLVETITAQYEFKFEGILKLDDFIDIKRYDSFYEQFALFANKMWMSKTGHNWDFSKVPFKSSSEKIDGLIKILRTGGAYSEEYDKAQSLEIEEGFRKRFQEDSAELGIYCIAEYNLSKSDESRSFTADIKQLGEVSSWFHQIAWDDLIFIINFEKGFLYVIALTDED
ncbi:MAG: hypothetical protein ACW97A_04655 [Candidatus Thorarchaeota archaeon]|jgi:hypothetical protein